MATGSHDDDVVFDCRYPDRDSQQPGHGHITHAYHDSNGNEHIIFNLTFSIKCHLLFIIVLVYFVCMRFFVFLLLACLSALLVSE